MSERKKRSNYLVQSGIKGKAILCSILILSLQLSFMASKIGMQGMNYYFVSVMLFLALYTFLGVSLPETLRKQINFQVCRGGFKNARRIYKVVALFHLFLTGLLALILFFFSEQISKMIFSSPLYSLNLKILAGALVVMVARKGMTGYLEGVNNLLPGIVAIYISTIISCITTVLIQNSCINYGNSLAAYMRQESYYYAYASLSGIIGLAVGNAFAFLFMLLIICLYRSVQSDKIKRDESRTMLSVFDILIGFYKNYIPEMFSKFAPCLLTVLLLFQYYRNSQASAEGMGSIAMGIFLFMLLPVGIAYLIASPLIRHLIGILKKQDKHHARERIAINMKLLTYFLFPYLSLVICMTSPLAQLLFDSTSDSIIHMMRIGIWVILFGTVSVFLFLILSAVYHKNILNVFLLISIVVGFFSFTIFAAGSMNPSDAFVCSLIIALLLTDLIYGTMLFKKLRFADDLIRIFLLPLVAAIVVGICAFIIGLITKNALPIITVILNLILNYFVYHIVLIMTHTFDKYEWNEVPGNRIPLFLAQKLNMY